MKRTFTSGFRGIISSLFSVGIILPVVFFAGCGGGMLKVKQEMDANPKVFVNSGSKAQKIWVYAPQSQISRIDQSLSATKLPLPSRFDEIAAVVAATLKEETGNPAVTAGSEDTVPKRKFLRSEIPDWGRSGYEILMDPSVDVYYSVSEATSGGKPSWSYELTGTTALYMWKINSKGGLEILRPNILGYYNLASVTKKLGSTFNEQKSLEELIELLPPTSIIEEMKAQARENVRKFYGEMKAAK